MRDGERAQAEGGARFVKIIAIEDEKLLLDALGYAIEKAEPEADVTLFRDAESTMAFPGVERADVAFIDVKLPQVNGVELARMLTDRNPRMNIVFVTGYDGYMKDAFDMHASGYIAKPVSADKVRYELDHLRHPVGQTTADGTEGAPASTGAPVASDGDDAPRLYAQCFGNFEAYVEGTPLTCKNARGMELLAYLVDRRGVRCSVRELEEVLWSNRPRTQSRKSNLRNVVADLAFSLREAGCEDVLLRQYGSVGLNTHRVSSDYWDYLDGKPGARRAFHGEYMTQFSWAERTLGNLMGL